MTFRTPLFSALITLLAPTVMAAAPATSEKATSLKEVTVTATRRAENVQKVPSAVSVIEREQVQTIGAAGDDVLVLGARSPSVQAESSFGRTFPRFYIRGLGNTDFDLNASQPVSFVYDDIVLENPTLKGFPLFDLDRIEVLRGPQGTLFGRNTPAGVIKFESVRPSQDTDAYAKIGFGRFGSANFEGAIGAAVNSASSFRLSALLQHRDNYATNSRINNDERGGYNERAARAQYLVAGDNFEALFQVRGRKLDGGSAIFQSNLFQRGSNAIVPDYRFDALAQDARPGLFVDTLGASARLRFDFAGMRLLSITGYESVDMFARGDVDGGFGASFAPPFGRGFIPFPAESGDGIPSHRQLTQEFRLESTRKEAFDWQLGTLFYDEHLVLDNLSYDTLAASTRNGYARQQQDNRAYALFGALGYQINDAVRVNGGLRYTRDAKDFYAERLQSPIGQGALARISVKPAANNLSGDLSLSYQLQPDVTVYGRFANGFRAPAVQGRLLFGDVVSVADEETLNSFEIGIKSEFFDKRARLNVALYDYRVNDIQLTAVGGAANFNTLINADHADGRGIEADVEALLSANWSASLGVSFNDTKLRDKDLAVQPCGSNCTVLDPRGTRPGTVSIDGNPLPQSPRFIGNFTTRYAANVGNGEWSVQTDWSYRTKVNFFLYESREFVGDPLLQGGLKLGYSWDDSRYEVALIGRNILNEIEAVGGVDFNNLTGFTNQPRYLGAEFSWRL